MQVTIVPDDPKRRLVAHYGPYSVWYDPLPHRPYGLFRVYKGGKYIGAQISVPVESDCQWLERQVYATESFRDDKPYGWTAIARGVAKPGSIRRFAYSQDEPAEVPRELQEIVNS